MSEESDPRDIRTALDAAIDAFNEEGFGVPTREDAIATDDEWKTQLTKACRLLDAVARIDGEGHYTAVIELASEQPSGLSRPMPSQSVVTSWTTSTTTRTVTTERRTSDCSPGRRHGSFGGCTTTTGRIATTAASAPPRSKRRVCTRSLAAFTSTSRTRYGKVASVSATLDSRDVTTRCTTSHDRRHRRGLPAAASFCPPSIGRRSVGR